MSGDDKRELIEGLVELVQSVKKLDLELELRLTAKTIEAEGGGPRDDTDPEEVPVEDPRES